MPKTRPVAIDLYDENNKVVLSYPLGGPDSCCCAGNEVTYTEAMNKMDHMFPDMDSEVRMGESWAG